MYFAALEIHFCLIKPTDVHLQYVKYSKCFATKPSENQIPIFHRIQQQFLLINCLHIYLPLLLSSPVGGHKTLHICQLLGTKASHSCDLKNYEVPDPCNM